MTRLAPIARAHAIVVRPTPPAPTTKTSSPGLTSAAVDTVQPDRERFYQRCVDLRHVVGQRECMPRGDGGEFGEAAAVGAHAEVAGLRAVRYRTRRAVLTATA